MSIQLIDIPSHTVAAVAVAYAHVLYNHCFGITLLLIDHLM